MKKKVIFTIGLLVVFFSIFHFLIAKSDGFEVASKYLRDNLEVIAVVGSISRISLIPLSSEVKDYGSKGNATYHIRIIGREGSAEGVVTSVKDDGKWRVTEAHLLLKNKSIVVLKTNEL